MQLLYFLLILFQDFLHNLLSHKTTYIVRVHFSQTAKETMEDKIKRLLREEVRKM